MKKLIFILAVFCILPVFQIKCYAQSPVEQLYKQFKIDELINRFPDTSTAVAEEILSEEITVENLISMTPTQIFSIIKKKTVETADLYKTELLLVITAVIFLSILNVVSAEEKINDIYELVCTLTIAAIMLNPVLTCISNGCEVISNISKFMLVYIPIYASVLAASGTFSGAAAYQTIVFSAAQIINQFSNSFFMPFMHGYMLLTLAGAISKNSGVSGISIASKKFINWSLTLITTLFTAILSFQSFIGSSTDSAFSKTAKFLFGSFVPVIGSAFSDALSAINGSIRVIKAMVGGIGVSAVALGFLPVILNITVLRISLWIANTIGDTLCTSNTKSIISGFSDVLSVLTALIICTIMLLIISTAIMMTSTTAMV